MTKLQKRKDATHWTLRQKTEQAAASGSSLVHNAGQSLGPGGRKLRAVDSGPSDLFGDDDEGDSKRRVKRELGAEGDLDELDFEETFADDEEKMEADDKEDEETKELEVRHTAYPLTIMISDRHLRRSDSNGSTRTLTSYAKGTLMNRTRRMTRRS